MKRFLAVLAMLLCFAGHSAIFNNTFTTQSTAGFSITGTNLSVPGVVRANGGAFTNSLTRNGIDAITGFGNVNLISRFTSANGIGSSSIGDDGVTVTMTEPLSLSAALTAQSGAFTNSLTLNGSPVLTNAPGSGITNAGTGTANTLAKWTDTNSLGNSTITNTASAIGLGNGSLAGTTFSGTVSDVIAAGDTALQTSAFTNSSAIFAIGAFWSDIGASNLFGFYGLGDSIGGSTLFRDSSEVLALGDSLFSSATVTSSDDLVGIGHSVFNSTVSQQNDDLFTFGHLGFSSAVITNSQDIFGFGYAPVFDARVTNSSQIYAIGQAVLDTAKVSGSSDIYAFGGSPLRTSTLTNVSDIYAIGNGAGQSVSLNGKSHIFMLGSGALATNSNDYVFGDSAYNYFFPGASASFAVVPTANGIPLLTNSVTISQNGTNGSPIVNMTNSATITWARSGSNWTANAVSSGTTVSVNGTNVSTPNLTNTATVTLAVSGSNILATAIVPSGTASASGTANTVAKFTSSTNLGNSSITDNGTTVALTSGITTVSGTQTNTATATNNVPFVAVGISGQTNDLQQWMIGTNVAQVRPSGAFWASVGSAASPSHSFIGNTNSGLRSGAGSAAVLTQGGFDRASIESGKLGLASAMEISWTSSTTDPTAGKDTYLLRDSAAVFQLGEDAATPVNQALKAHDGSGTDKAGANFTLEGGQGTGTGAGGTLFFATAKARTTASTANPYTNWVSLDANGVLAAGTVVVTNYVRMPWTTLTMTGSNVSSIDFAAASMFKLTLTNDAFFVAPSNLPGTNSAQTIQVHVLQDATGTRTLTMTNSAWVMAGSGTATNAVVALNTNANSVTVLTFVTSPFSATQVYGTLVTPGL